MKNSKSKNIEFRIKGIFSKYNENNIVSIKSIIETTPKNYYYI